MAVYGVEAVTMGKTMALAGSSRLFDKLFNIVGRSGIDKIDRRSNHKNYYADGK